LSNEIEKLEQAIAALEMQRAIVGDAVVDMALAPLRDKLAALRAQPLEQQRKQVTVLFADVSGFTALAEAMDAEDVSNLINALWQRLDAAILAQGGLIDKHIGDGVMALWGAETAHEDDPERAVRAAIAMQQNIRESKPENRTPGLPPSANPDLNFRLSIRIGVNTGPVLLGAVGTLGEFTAVGDTVNVASRLQEAAPPGGILISYDTYRHVRGIFEVETNQPLALKGKSELLQTYLVHKIRPRAFRLGMRGVEGIETHMVGRSAEMCLLQETIRTVFQEKKLQAVTITGEAGMGKSRLLHEFEKWLDIFPEWFWLFKAR
jgi:class 3 adenylate cyclase